MKWNSRTRCTLICIAFTVMFSGFSCRLVYLQIIKHDEYAGRAADKHGDKVTIFAERGTILDANGEVLAHNVPADLVYANPSIITKASELVPILAQTLHLPPQDLLAKLSKPSKYVILKRQVAPAVTAQLRETLEAKNLRGIRYERDPARYYPNGSALCHVIGFTDFEQKGIQGIEGSMEDYLHGQDGYRFIERNRRGEEIAMYRGQERASRDGYNVQLTIDSHLQAIVEKEIDVAVSKYSPQKATIILMRPDTGEILAMANRPNFDLNLRATANEETKKNRAITDVMEPGSTFKIVTTAAAINEKKVSPDSMIFCENGLWNYGGQPLHDSHSHGELSVRDILVKSSNIGAAKLALSLGDQKFYEYIRMFGFGERTDIELPSEISGILSAPQKWQKISPTRIAMGQGVGVTPLQMVTAMAAIANGGKLMKPRIVKSITRADGGVVSGFTPTVIRQVISPTTAQQISNALRGVVSDQGTAADAAVQGFEVCGKTGTAQRKAEGKPGYEPGKYVVSFSGFMPAEDPQFVALVVLDDAKTTAELNYGGKVAGPIFARIAEQAARYLDLQPHEEPRKALPVRQVALTEARRR